MRDQIILGIILVACCWKYLARHVLVGLVFVTRLVHSYVQRLDAADARKIIAAGRVSKEEDGEDGEEEEARTP
jgi:hypothetical protein